MAIYRQIHTHIWDDPNFETLSPHAKLVFIYGFSNRHRNEAGLYTLTIRKLAFETSLSIEEAEVAVKEIEARGMWRYDWDNQVLWVKNALKYQTVTEKNLAAIKKDIATINSPLVAEFEEHYKDLLSPTEGPPKGDRRGIELPPKNNNGNGNGNDNGKGNVNSIMSELGSSDTPPAPTEEKKDQPDILDKSPEEPKPPKYLPEHMELAEYLRGKILKNKPDARLPTSLVKWAETARLMIERDNRTPELIRQVIDWCQSDHFWWKNILSMEKLREKFDRLEAEMNETIRASPVDTREGAKSIRGKTEKDYRGGRYGSVFAADMPFDDS